MTMKNPTTNTTKIWAYGLDYALANDCVNSANPDPIYRINGLSNAQIYTVNINSAIKNMAMLVYNFA